MGYAFLFAETYFKLFSSAPNGLKGLAGIFLRQLWGLVAFLLVSFFCSNLKASLSKVRSPTLLETNEDVVQSKRPLILEFTTRAEYENLATTNNLDKQIHANAKYVFTWDR